MGELLTLGPPAKVGSAVGLHPTTWCWHRSPSLVAVVRLRCPHDSCSWGRCLSSRAERVLAPARAPEWLLVLYGRAAALWQGCLEGLGGDGARDLAAYRLGHVLGLGRELVRRPLKVPAGVSAAWPGPAALQPLRYLHETAEQGLQPALCCSASPRCMPDDLHRRSRQAHWDCSAVHCLAGPADQ